MIKNKGDENCLNNHQMENTLISYQILSVIFKEMCGDQSGEFVWGSLYISGKLPTYPSPKQTLTLTSHVGQNVGLGEG